MSTWKSMNYNQKRNAYFFILFNIIAFTFVSVSMFGYILIGAGIGVAYLVFGIAGNYYIYKSHYSCEHCGKAPSFFDFFLYFSKEAFLMRAGSNEASDVECSRCGHSIDRKAQGIFWNQTVDKILDLHWFLFVGLTMFSAFIVGICFLFLLPFFN